eukprot:3860604-Prymnesium_polylepis.1
MPYARSSDAEQRRPTALRPKSSAPPTSCTNATHPFIPCFSLLFSMVASVARKANICSMCSYHCPHAVAKPRFIRCAACAEQCTHNLERPHHKHAGLAWTQACSEARPVCVATHHTPHGHLHV